MAMGRKASRWVVGVLGVGALAAVGVSALAPRHPSDSKVANRPGSPASRAELAEGVRDGNRQALAALVESLAPPATGAARPSAISDAEAADLVGALSGLRAGFLHYDVDGRKSCLSAAIRVLDRFAKAPSPAGWAAVLPPSHDLVTAGLADHDPRVRIEALDAVGALWLWTPDRTLMAQEDHDLAIWREGFHAPAVRLLGDRAPETRAAAVACLGRLPLTDAAAPAAAYIDDPDVQVRAKVLTAFAQRPDVLSELAILRRLGDDELKVAEMAEIVLRGRGLSREQIGLGKMIIHPKPDVRSSVIALLADRTDIDPVVWFLELSRDADETVRARAVEALAGRDVPEARRRLAEMAGSDASPAIREAAGKAIPATTAALPPLPGSTSLLPKAN